MWSSLLALAVLDRRLALCARAETARIVASTDISHPHVSYLTIDAISHAEMAAHAKCYQSHCLDPTLVKRARIRGRPPRVPGDRPSGSTPTQPASVADTPTTGLEPYKHPYKCPEGYQSHGTYCTNQINSVGAKRRRSGTYHILCRVLLPETEGMRTMSLPALTPRHHCPKKHHCIAYNPDGALSTERRGWFPGRGDPEPQVSCVPAPPRSNAADHSRPRRRKPRPRSHPVATTGSHGSSRHAANQAASSSDSTGDEVDSNAWRADHSDADGVGTRFRTIGDINTSGTRDPD